MLGKPLNILIGTFLLLQGCTSAPVTVFPLPPPKYEVLGRVSGLECGTLALLGAGVNVFPVQLNSRLERAYQEAVQTIPGTTSLINVEVREDWFWWILATTRCTLVTGDAIKGVRL